MRRCFVGPFSAVLMSLCVGQVQAAGEDVTIGIPNWTSAHITGEILKYISESDLGLTVGTVPSTNPVIFKAMHDGKGDLDVHPEVWMPNQAGLAKQYVEEAGTVAFGDNPYDARQAYCVPKHTAETLNLKSVYDLADPEVSKQFDTNGDGKGELWVGAHGWASTNVEKVRMRDFGVADFWELVELDEAIFYSALANAAESKRHYAGFCQSPNNIFAQYELVWLEEPAFDPEKWHMVQPTDDPEWYQKSKITVGWPATTLHVAYSKTLEERAPELVTLIKNMALDNDTMSSLILEVVETGRDPAEVAAKWVDNNRPKVDKWLGLQ